MSESLSRSATQLTLAQVADDTAISADWVGKLFMLGRLIAQWSRIRTDIQLLVALSVPVRDFAGLLVACGWMTAAPSPGHQPVTEVLAGLRTGAPVRVVSQNKVFTERLGGIDLERGRVKFGTDWQIKKLRAVVPLASLDTPRSQPVPEPGVISRLTGLDKEWSARLCSPLRELALVGTKTRLKEDLGALLGRGDELEPVANILLPKDNHCATWSTRVYVPSQLDDELSLAEARAVVLDGAPATRYVSAVEAPVIVSVLDRSIADESASEFIMNYRNTRGEPVSLKDDLHWIPPLGVEALAFELPL